MKSVRRGGKWQEKCGKWQGKWKEPQIMTHGKWQKEQKGRSRPKTRKLTSRKAVDN